VGCLVAREEEGRRRDVLRPGELAEGRFPAIEPMTTTDPRRRSTIPERTDRQKTNAPVRFTSSTCAHSSSGHSQIGTAGPLMPLFEMAMSSGRAALTARRSLRRLKQPIDRLNSGRCMLMTDTATSPTVGACPFPGLAAMHAGDQSVLRNRAVVYDEARVHGPVQWVPEFDAFFVLGRDELVEVCAHPEVFSSCIARGRGAMDVEDRVRQMVIESPQMADLVAHGYGQDSHVRAGLVADPPSHTRQRALIAPAFRPARVRAIDRMIREVTSELLDEVVEQAAGGAVVDLLEVWAEPFPLRVLAAVLGVPADRVDDYARWGEGLLLPVGKASVTDDQFEEMVAARREFDRFFGHLILDRRANPRDDFISDFVTGAEAEGEEPLSLDEMLAIIEQSVIAGHETTTKLMSSTMLWLSERPDLLDRLHGDRKVVDAFVEEMLRLESPSQYGTRLAVSDYDLGGVRIRAGSAVIISWGAANRDGREFVDPNLLDIQRENRAAHVGFGHGIHYCAGHALGRTEMRVGLELFADRFTRVELAVPGGREALDYAPSSMLHGPTSLPCRLTER